MATGIIEAACRHLIKDRFDITGARWSLNGAEAILKLRAVWNNGDWSAYLAYHLAEEQQRVHDARYAPGTFAAMRRFHRTLVRTLRDRRHQAGLNDA